MTLPTVPGYSLLKSLGTNELKSKLGVRPCLNRLKFSLSFPPSPSPLLLQAAFMVLLLCASWCPVCLESKND